MKKVKLNEHKPKKPNTKKKKEEKEMQRKGKRIGRIEMQVKNVNIKKKSKEYGV